MRKQLNVVFLVSFPVDGNWAECHLMWEIMTWMAIQIFTQQSGYLDLMGRFGEEIHSTSLKLTVFDFLVAFSFTTIP